MPDDAELQSFYSRDPADWSFARYAAHAREVAGDFSFFATDFRTRRNRYTDAVESLRIKWTEQGKKSLAGSAARALLTVEGWRQEEASYIANRKIHSDKIKTWTYLDTALDGAMVDLTNMHQEDQNMRKKRRMTGITSERNMADSAVGHGMADPAAERKMADLADVNLVPKENEGVNDVVPPEVDDVAPSDLDVVKPNPPPMITAPPPAVFVMTNDQIERLTTGIVEKSMSNGLRIAEAALAREQEAQARERQLFERLLDQQRREAKKALDTQALAFAYERELGRISVRSKLELVATNIRWCYRLQGLRAPTSTSEIFRAMRSEYFGKYQRSQPTPGHCVCVAIDAMKESHNVDVTVSFGVLDTLFPRLSGNAHFSSTDVLDRSMFTDPKEFLLLKELFLAFGIPFHEPARPIAICQGADGPAAGLTAGPTAGPPAGPTAGGI